MINMSYCRFENTYRALQEAYDDMDKQDLSDSEKEYRQWLVELCATVAEEYDNLTGGEE